MVRRASVVIWIALMAVSSLLVARLHVGTDMSAFLPRAASPAQRVLVDQFRDGVVSRLVLVAIEGVSPDRAAAISKRLADRLRGNSDFVAVENGEERWFDRDRAFLWSNRYLLSDRVGADRFTSAGLRTALRHDLADLGSAAGFLVQRTLAADPTGEMLHLVEQQLGGGEGPVRHDGVWVSPDGGRALMLVRLRAAGSDIDGAQQALAAIRSAFGAAAADPLGQASAAGPLDQTTAAGPLDQTTAAGPLDQTTAAGPLDQTTTARPLDQTTPAGPLDARLVMTGAPVFAVQARDRIKSDATRLSVLAGLLVATALLVVYRSVRVLVLAFVPVVSGAVVGVAAVGVVFRTVHGITLGFGATLIGEAVDYAVYLFTQTAPDSPVGATIARIWPTLRLGVLTSICGFSAMLLSSFEGFAQLGLFTITGLAVAVCVTRWVLPVLIPAGFTGARQSRTMLRIAGWAMRGRRLRVGVVLLVVVAAASLGLDRGRFWAGDLASLSPVPAAEQRLDQSLRRDMRAPDAGLLVVIRRPDQEAALQAAERVTGLLAPLVADGALAGFDSPARYLPSLAAQRERQGALPDAAELRVALDAAQEGLPFQPGLFAPFVAALGKARSGPLIRRSDLDGTSLSLQLDQLLTRQGDGWVAMLPLRGVTATLPLRGVTAMLPLRGVTATLSSRGVASPDAIARAIAGEPDAVLVDLRAESDRLLRVYLREGVSLACLGAAAIGLLLAVSLRSWRRLAVVAAPLAAAVVVTLAVLRLGGHALSIFNLFGVLLVVAIGSNYCLFFDRQRGDPVGMPRVLASLLLANACTVAGFGVLALSGTPVLHDLGLPVAVGTLLSLWFATIIMSPVQQLSLSHAAAR